MIRISTGKGNNMAWSLTERERGKVNAALISAGYTKITWDRDTVRCNHRRNKSPCDIVRKAGFFVACGGVAERPYCQVWSKRRYFAKVPRDKSGKAV